MSVEVGSTDLDGALWQDRAMSDHRVHSGRAFERFVNFTDAVVAIAITLLVLPLIEIKGPSSGETVWEIIGDNFGQIFAFVLTFFLVARNWLTHNKIINTMRGYDGPVFWLNIVWIASIALLPWATAMYGSADEWDTSGEGFAGTGLFFFVTLAFTTIIATWISVYIDRHPELVDPEKNEERLRDRISGRVRSVVFSLLFVVIGVLTIYLPSIAPYLPFLLIPIGFSIRSISNRLEARS